MNTGLVRVRGEIVRGHGVASGVSGDPRFPRGTIALQLGYLREQIVGFDAFLEGDPFPGTINVAIARARVQAGIADYIIGPVRWTEAFPAERFLISRAAIEYRDRHYPAYLYIPDPTTKPEHHQAPNIVEVLARRIPALYYGESLWLLHNSASLSISVC